MKTVIKNILVYFLVLLPVISMADRSTAQNEIKTEYSPKSVFGKNFIGIELLGRGIAYSINYDRALNSKFSLGAGFTYYQWDVVGIGVDIALLPIYGQYYFAGFNKHRGFVSATASIVYAKAEIRSDIFSYSEGNPSNLIARSEGTTVLPNAGVGYEFRANSGFTSRVAAYAQYISGTTYPWAGVMLGMHF